MNLAIIIPAAGEGKRLGKNYPKAFVKLKNKPILQHSIDTISNLKVPVKVFIGISEKIKKSETLFTAKNLEYFIGGKEREETVKKGLNLIKKENFTHVLVTDAARPFVSTNLYERLIEELKHYDAVVPVLDSVNSVKIVDSQGFISQNLIRDNVKLIQTPQAYKIDILSKAFNVDENIINLATDESELVLKAGIKIKTIPGEISANKITVQKDLEEFENENTKSNFIESDLLRIGNGVDIHKTSPKALCYLGGIFFEDTPGCLGFSDGDVALHAICDSLFAAANLGDLGSNFGENNPVHENIRSTTLLKEAVEILHDNNFKIINITVQIICKKPRFSFKRLESEKLLSEIAAAPVSVSATTSDGVGEVGLGLAIEAHAVSLIKKVYR